MKIHIKTISNTIAAFLILFLATSCEEVIEIDLNSSNPIMVVEGAIDNGEPAWINISYTTDYFDSEQANVEAEATVIISDNAGQSETLEYISGGLYQGKDLIGSWDKQYTVIIRKDDIEYEASSTLFPPSEIFTVKFEENINQKPGQDSTSYTISINFKDDPLSRNYYLIKYRTNGVTGTNSYFLVDDYSYENTGTIEYAPMRSNFTPDDEVMIELYSIDEATYIYYSELNNAGGDSMLGSSTPFTPK